MRSHGTVHVKVLLNPTWAVTSQNMDHKHGDFAAKLGTSGASGPLTDNKREKLRRLFFFYVPNYFIFIPLLVIQSRDVGPASLRLHVQHAYWDHRQHNLHFSQFSISNSKWWNSLTCCRLLVAFELTEERVGWTGPQYPLQRVQQHTLPLT